MCSTGSQLYVGSKLSNIYQQSRPTYPPIVYDTIINYLKGNGEEPARCELAVDIACGTGQGTVALASHFTRVIGCDVSETQVQEAQRENITPNVEYCVSPGEEFAFLEDASVDLLTCAAAFHWLDHETAFKEIKRVLRKDGVLALYHYNFPSAENVEAKSLLDEFWHVTCRPYVAQEVIDFVYNKYSTIEPPMDDVQRYYDFSIERSLPLSSFLMYVGSTSCYRRMLAAEPDSTALEELEKKLRAILAPKKGESSGDPLFTIFHPLFLVLSKN